jgi:hypothetical protein
MLLDGLVRPVGVPNDNLMTAGDDIVQTLLNFGGKTGNVPRAADEDGVH